MYLLLISLLLYTLLITLFGVLFYPFRSLVNPNLKYIKKRGILVREILGIYYRSYSYFSRSQNHVDQAPYLINLYNEFVVFNKLTYK